MANKLFRRKPLNVLLEEMHGENRLRRILGPVTLTSLGVGAIIGTGIFVLTGVAAHDKAGPALMLSFVVAGIACIFAAFCYAEFASMVPVAGSAYTYAYATLGELFAWIIGWDLVLEYAVASATVAHGWSHYFQDFIGIFGSPFPRSSAGRRSTRSGDRAHRRPPGSWLDLPAIVITAIVTAILVKGIRESATFNAAMVIVKLVIVLFVIVVGRVLRQPRELGTLRAVRLDRDQLLRQDAVRPDRRRRGTARDAGRRGDQLLRLHRVRLGLDPRRGGQETRSGTCRSASSPRCSSARSSTSSSRRS